MANLDLTCNTAQGKVVLLHPESADQRAAIVEGTPAFATDSGDATFVYDPATPDRFQVFSGPAAGVSVVSVRGHSAGSPDVVDTVTLTADLAPAVLADFGMSDGGTITK